MTLMAQNLRHSLSMASAALRPHAQNSSDKPLRALLSLFIRASRLSEREMEWLASKLSVNAYKAASGPQTAQFVSCCKIFSFLTL